MAVVSGGNEVAVVVVVAARHLPQRLHQHVEVLVVVEHRAAVGQRVALVPTVQHLQFVLRRSTLQRLLRVFPFET